MAEITAEDVEYVLSSLEKSERADIKRYYLTQFGFDAPTPREKAGGRAADVFGLLSDAGKLWELSQLLFIARVIECDERALWEKIGPNFHSQFRACGDLWTEQKAVKWVRRFVEYRRRPACDLAALWCALAQHAAEVLKPRGVSGTEEKGGVDVEPAPLSVTLPADVSQCVEVVPMQGMQEGLLRCRRPQPAFQELLRVPRKLLFCRPTVDAFCQLAHAVAATPTLHDILEHEETLLVLCLVYERFFVAKRNLAASHWSALLERCPAAYPLVPSFWDFRDLAELEGVDVLDEVLERREELHLFHERVAAVLPTLHIALQLSASHRSENDGLTLDALTEAFSLEALQWARATFDSRAFYLNIDGTTRLTLAPVADMINHSNHSDVLVRHVLPNNGDFVMEIGAALTQEDVGRELWMSYGPLQNWELLEYYGFVLEGNAHDRLPFPFQLPGKEEGEEADTTVVGGATNREWDRRRDNLVQKYFLCSLGRCWIASDGAPCHALLALLRVQFASVEEMQSMESGAATPFSTLSGETEVTVVEAVQNTISCVLELFSSTLEEDLEALCALSDASAGEEEDEESEEEDGDVRKERYRLALVLRSGLKRIAARSLQWCSKRLDEVENSRTRRAAQ